VGVERIVVPGVRKKKRRVATIVEKVKNGETWRFRSKDGERGHRANCHKGGEKKKESCSNVKEVSMKQGSRLPKNKGETRPAKKKSVRGRTAWEHQPYEKPRNEGQRPC